MSGDLNKLSADDVLESTRAERMADASEHLTQPEDNGRPAAQSYNPYVPRLPEDYPTADTYDIGEDTLTELPEDEDSKESL